MMIFVEDVMMDMEFPLVELVLNAATKIAYFVAKMQIFAQSVMMDI